VEELVMMHGEKVGSHRPDWRVTVAGIELEITVLSGARSACSKELMM
jgi:hypothetical protein